MRMSLFLVLFQACNTEGGLSVVPDVPDAPVAELRVAPAQLIFDGSNDVQWVTVANDGDDDLLIEDVAAYLSDELFDVGEPALRVVRGGESTRLSVEWVGGSMVEASGRLVVSTDAPEPSQGTVEVWTEVPDVGPCDPAGVPFGGGTGVASEPYRVCSPVHLSRVRDEPGAWFEMHDDVDLTDLELAPIGPFSGSFDGRSHHIIGWSHSDASRGVSLFGDLTGGHVHDLVLESVSVTGGQGSGALAGVLRDGGSIERVRVIGAQITGTDGLFGGVLNMVTAGTRIADVSFDGDIVSLGTTGFVGGIASGCRGECTRLVTSGTMTAGSSWKVGGIVNEANGTISGCASHMDISAGSRIGGVAAVLVDGVIEDCYADGALSGVHWVGGLVGESYGGFAPEIRRSYAVGPLSASAPEAGIGTGGLVAWEAVLVNVSDSWWDVSSTGATYSAGGVALDAARSRDPNEPVFATWVAPWVLTPGELPSLAFE